MRDRHLPRLCRDCRRPLASQEHTCWNCGAACPRADQATASAPTTESASARFDDDGGHPELSQVGGPSWSSSWSS